MRQLLFIIVLLLISSQAKSQLTGYQGKRFLVKADLVDLALNDGFGLSAEFAFARRMSLSLNANKRSLFFEDLTDPPSFSDGDDDKDELIVNSKSYGLGIRWYKSQAFTAPKGVYSYINVNVGQTDVELYYIKFNYGSSGPRSSRSKDEIEDLIYASLELGIGNQTIVANRIVLDISIGYNTASFIAGDYNGEILYNSRSRIDRNLWGFEIDEERYIGFSGHLSIGFLLF